MVTINDEQAFAIANYRLIKVDDGRTLMVRRLRAVDADSFNRQWSERGIPTRWERQQQAAAVA
ncbi:MAG TPA: hypothetical protein DCS97_13255 [Planctomycetes bacterium]|nr:hypothetical protein [Planctomycetota bacterium]